MSNLFKYDQSIDAWKSQVVFPGKSVTSTQISLRLTFKISLLLEESVVVTG